jgi:glycosyltransferase involved in cell wall biosynthesis
MRVAIVAPADPLVERPGGTRTYVMSLVNSLQKSQIDFSLVGVDFDGGDGSPAFDFTPVVTGPKVSSVRFLRGLMRHAKKSQLSKDTIIHAQRPDFLFPYMFRKHDNKMLCTLHGQLSRSVKDRKGRFYGTAYRLLESYSMKNVDHVIAVDQSTLDLFVGKYPLLSGRSSLIPVGIDVNGWGEGDRESSRQRYGFTNDQKVAVYVGRLEKEKRVDLIIETVKSVKKDHDDFRLAIIGDGTLRGYLEDFAESYAPGSVSFMGAQPVSVVRDMMTAADVFCLASDFESGPLVVLESLATGTPVVATNVGRIGEFIQDPSTGRIVQQDPDSMASAILQVVSGNREEVSRKCVEKAREFSFDKSFQKTLEVYEDLSR